jgi:hypothetical protein
MLGYVRSFFVASDIHQMNQTQPEICKRWLDNLFLVVLIHDYILWMTHIQQLLILVQTLLFQSHVSWLALKYL